MGFTSFYFYVFLAITVIAYYIVPLRFRWYVLLAASLSYFVAATTFRREFCVLLGMIAVSWLFGLLHGKLREMAAAKKEDQIIRFHRIRQCLLAVSVLSILLPLFLSRYPSYLYTAENILHLNHTGVLVSIGISFFTMQIIAYLADVYCGKIQAQKNPLKYTLFISFFPQIIQGPIPRYDQLEPQLVKGHRFDEKGFVNGFMLIIWGFFLKLMIADRAGVVVDTVFEYYESYQGSYVLVAGVLYSVQLYADFLACTSLSQGMSELFGIHLVDNFRRPYFSTSISEFWRRWHMSLSQWLRDYIYIPLGGNRKGRVRKYINLCITFIVSGIWHGTGWKYIFWGLMHAGYQIAGALTKGVRNKLYIMVGLAEGRRARVWIGRACTFFFVMLTWIVFRAPSLKQGLFMLRSLFAVYNPWVFFNDALLELGLDWKESMVLIFSVLTLIWVSVKQEAGMKIRDAVLRQPYVLRCALYAAAIVIIMIFGSYGTGFDASDFIYGGF